MEHQEVLELIERRPSVHRLCYGACLQSSVSIGPDVLAVPLAALGFNTELDYVASYLRQFFRIELTTEGVHVGRAQAAAIARQQDGSARCRRDHWSGNRARDAVWFAMSQHRDIAYGKS